MGWFWADPPAPTGPGRLHVEKGHPKQPLHNHTAVDGKPPEGCPMHAPSSRPDEPPEGCPMHSSASSNPTEYLSTPLNPTNLMPHLPSTPIHSDQSAPLPGDRTVSSIPKGTTPDAGNWEYPSPQQMYNAMRRKGFVESYPGEILNIVGMVEVHNFLNEGAWGEIVSWEREFRGGWWEAARRRWQRGGILPEEDLQPNETEEAKTGPRLVRFQGKSQEWTPKVRVLQTLSRVYPEKFGTPPPFDRHDWYVLRHPREEVTEGAKPEEVRYVIDYYAGDPEPTGEPVFYLDVRPALDRPGAVMERVVRWGGDIWWRASGGIVRERERRKKEMEAMET
ncbi:cytochrome c/c1 heme-lyase [Kalaharituber pfeilii]|nr:cytochrome c/c1 heme-lyase [Kalaharituber pfeilii]